MLSVVRQSVVAPQKLELKKLLYLNLKHCMLIFNQLLY
jgi:hypothetical protein